MHAALVGMGGVGLLAARSFAGRILAPSKAEEEGAPAPA